MKPAEEGIEKCRVGNWKEGMDDLGKYMPMLDRRVRHTVTKLRRFMGTDQEIEFTVDRGKLSVLQSRAAEIGALINLVIDHTRLGRHDEARVEMEKAIELEPQSLDLIVAQQVIEHVIDAEATGRKLLAAQQRNDDAVPLREPRNQLAEQGLVLVRDADPGGRGIADDQETQQRAVTDLALPCPGRLGQRRDAQVGPQALRHDDGRQADCP